MSKYINYKFQSEKSFLKNIVYLQLNAKTAISGPPIGPILGQCGIPAAPFCKEFNERTKFFKNNILVKVKLYIFINGEYNFDIYLPTDAFFLKKIINLKNGYRTPGYIFSNSQEVKNKGLLSKYKYITPYLLYEILNYKKNNYLINNTHFLSNYKKFLGILKSIGILIYI
jgi:ribosomal protein L11